MEYGQCKAKKEICSVLLFAHLFCIRSGNIAYIFFFESRITCSCVLIRSSTWYFVNLGYHDLIILGISRLTILSDSTENRYLGILHSVDVNLFHASSGPPRHWGPSGGGASCYHWFPHYREVTELILIELKWLCKLYTIFATHTESIPVPFLITCEAINRYRRIILSHDSTHIHRLLTTKRTSIPMKILL